MRADARADQHVPDVAQRAGLRQVIEQVVGDWVAALAMLPNSWADRLLRSQVTTMAGLVILVSATSRGHNCAETTPAGASEQDVGALSRDAGEAAPAAMDLSSRPHSRQA